MYHWPLRRSQKFHFERFENQGGPLPYNNVAGQLKWKKSIRSGDTNRTRKTRRGRDKTLRERQWKANLFQKKKTLSTLPWSVCNSSGHLLAKEEKDIMILGPVCISPSSQSWVASFCAGPSLVESCVSKARKEKTQHWEWCKTCFCTNRPNQIPSFFFCHTSSSSNNERPIPSFRIWNNIAKTVGHRGGCLWKWPMAVNGSVINNSPFPCLRFMYTEKPKLLSEASNLSVQQYIEINCHVQRRKFSEGLHCIVLLHCGTPCRPTYKECQIGTHW